MKLTEMNLTKFTEVLASSEPAPGGGSTAALSGALGAALGAMVCGLSRVGKSAQKYAEYQDMLADLEKKCLTLSGKFLDLIDRDTEAFNIVSDAFKMPKSNDDEKAARSEAIQKGLEACTETPFEMMELALETLKLTVQISGKSNETAASDLGVSALTLKTAVQGAWLNVLINIGSLKNKELADSYRNRGEEILNECVLTADKIYNEVMNTIK